MEQRLGLVGEPFREGRSGQLMKAARAATIAAGALTLLSSRSRTAAALAGAAGITASALTRFGIFEAGKVSARDPKYTVGPQRDRAPAARAKDSAGRQ
jgi:hypothetical protein